MIVDAEGRTFYLNKRTGVHVTARPPDFVEEVDDDEEENKTAEDKPTTRTTRLSCMPPAIASRRAALARSAESSQLL